MKKSNGTKILFLAAALFFVACSSDNGNSPSASDHTCTYSAEDKTLECPEQTYKTVVIGTQTWMAENLNYAVDSSWCYIYNNDSGHCAEYGRLYQWAAAMNIAPKYNQTLWEGSDKQHQGLCPDGWHIPSDEDWQTFSDYARANNDNEGVGTSLKSTSGWNNDGNGTDRFGFSGLPGGYRLDNGAFEWLGQDACFWSATEKDAENASYRYLYYFYEDLTRNDYYKNYGRSIRCLKN